MTKMTYAVLRPDASVEFVEFDQPVPFSQFGETVGFPMQVLNVPAHEHLPAAALVVRHLSDEPANARATSLVAPQQVHGTAVLAGPTDQLMRHLNGLPEVWVAWLDGE